MKLLCVILLCALWGCAADTNDAVSRLEYAPQFAFGPIGYAARTSPGEAAYREIMTRPTAAADFEQAFQMGNPQAKAFALTALAKLNPVRFAALSAEFLKQNPRVSVMYGCIGHQVTSTVIVDEIQRSKASK